MREIGSINDLFFHMHECARSINRIKIYENERVAKNGSRISAGNQGADCFNWKENSGFAKFSLWIENEKIRRIKNPKISKNGPAVFGLVLCEMIKLRIIQVKNTNPSTPIDTSQPRRMVKVIRLKRPKRNVKLPGNLISNSI